MDYKTAISDYKSVREYQKKSIPEKDLFYLKDYCKRCKKLVPSIDVECKILTKERVFPVIEKDAGYSGFFIDAPYYLFLLSQEHEHAIENGGYLGEDLVLQATGLGIDSCWITFDNGNAILDKVGLRGSKKLVALIALGYGANGTNKKVINVPKSSWEYTQNDLEIVPNNISPRKSVEEIVFVDKWGENASAADLDKRGILDAFLYARLAPSTLNQQPWKFLLQDELLTLCIHTQKDRNIPQEKINAGIVMLHFDVLISYYLFELNWKLGLPDPKPEIPEEYEIIGYCHI